MESQRGSWWYLKAPLWTTCNQMTPQIILAPVGGRRHCHSMALSRTEILPLACDHSMFTREPSLGPNLSGLGGNWMLRFSNATYFITFFNKPFLVQEPKIGLRIWSADKDRIFEYNEETCLLFKLILIWQEGFFRGSSGRVWHLGAERPGFISHRMTIFLHLPSPEIKIKDTTVVNSIWKSNTLIATWSSSF